MDALDPRHGSEAGHEQHLRDGEDPCDACIDGDRKATRRRTKRKSMGYRYLAPLGDIYWQLQALRKQGATYDDIMEWSGVVESQIWRALNGGPETVVYARTWHRLHSMKAGRIITPLGITRRIRALMWLGYSAQRIAAESGCHSDTIRDACDQPRVFLARKVKTGIADAYDRLAMTLPTGETQQERAGITRSRNRARSKGWPPPMAYDDIDDLNENPTDWQYRPGDRTEDLRDLAEQGVGITEACRRLQVGHKTLREYCRRHGISDIYHELAGRELRAENQHTDEVA